MQLAESLRTFRLKLFLTLFIFTAVISLTFTGIYTHHEIRTYRQNATEKAQVLANLLASSSRLAVFGANLAALEKSAADIGRYPGVNEVTIYDADGTILSKFGDAQSTRPEAATSAEALITAAAFSQFSESNNKSGSSPGKPIGLVRVKIDNTELKSAIRSLITKSAITALIFWLLLSYLGYLIVQWITKSLTTLTSGIQTIRGGDYSLRITPTGNDEIAEAAHAVNDLAAELQRRESDNKRLQKELIDAMKSEVRDERRKMMAKLIQTNRMTSLGLLVSGMAHEINTPNGAIKLAGQQVAKAWCDATVILDEVARDEGDIVLGGLEYSHARTAVIKATEVIMRSTERIDQVIKDLRSYSLGERNGLSSSVDVNQSVTNALTIIRANGERGFIQLLTSLGESIPTVAGNRHQLEQVITNLLLNAIQAVPSGEKGVINVSTDLDEEGRNVVIRITDNGGGIPTEVMDHLLEPFFTTRIDEGGSGLGLYIANFIVEEHRGKLTIRSEQGVGTIVTVMIPL